jgi:hypothetical protein
VLKTERRIIMAKTVAKRYLESRLNEEYRLQVYGNFQDIKKLPNLLRSFRDGKLKLAGLDVGPIPDLGIQENFDSIEIWSSHRDPLKKLAHWFEKKGMETTGIW